MIVNTLTANQLVPILRNLTPAFIFSSHLDLSYSDTTAYEEYVDRYEEPSVTSTVFASDYKFPIAIVINRSTFYDKNDGITAFGQKYWDKYLSQNLTDVGIGEYIYRYDIAGSAAFLFFLHTNHIFYNFINKAMAEIYDDSRIEYKKPERQDMTKDFTVSVYPYEDYIYTKEFLQEFNDYLEANQIKVEEDSDEMDKEAEFYIEYMPYPYIVDISINEELANATTKGIIEALYNLLTE